MTNMSSFGRAQEKLKKCEIGRIVRVYWADPSADSTQDGSPTELLAAHYDVKYATVGYFMGIDKRSGTVVLCSDKRQQDKEAKKPEFRGTLNIMLSLIYKVTLH